MAKVFKPVTDIVQSVLGIEAPSIPAPVVIPAAEKPPVVTPPKEMPAPTPDSAQRKSAIRQSVAEQRRRRGRQSTILTTDLEDTLG